MLIGPPAVNETARVLPLLIRLVLVTVTPVNSIV